MEPTERLLPAVGPHHYPDPSLNIWSHMDHDGRYLMRIYAAVLRCRTRPVLTHLSAARIWGLPILGPWPHAVHLHGAPQLEEPVTDEIVWHNGHLSDSDTIEIGGLLTTTRLRTMLDLARSQPFRSAVISLDAGLQQPYVLPGGIVVPTVSKHRLLERVHALTGRGADAARAVAQFADPRSTCTGHSLSRATMHLARLPMPDLQAFSGSGARKIRVDFRWHPRFHVKRQVLLGQFTYAGSAIRDAGRVDELSGRPNSVVVSWSWADALQPERMRALLLNAGLRPIS